MNARAARAVLILLFWGYPIVGPGGKEYVIQSVFGNHLRKNPERYFETKRKNIVITSWPRENSPVCAPTQEIAFGFLLKNGDGIVNCNPLFHHIKFVTAAQISITFSSYKIKFNSRIFTLCNKNIRIECCYVRRRSASIFYHGYKNKSGSIFPIG